MNTALILIDIQNDYFPDGKNPLVGSLEASQQAARLLGHFRQHGLPVIHIRHISNEQDATFFLPGSPGVQTHPSVAPTFDEPDIEKHSPNSFLETRLLDLLRSQGIERLVVGGMMTHMCVDATVRAAVDLGYECWLAQDACATKDLKFGGAVVPAVQVHSAFLAALQDAYASVMPTIEILERLA